MSNLIQKDSSFTLRKVGSHAGYGAALVAAALVAVLWLNPDAAPSNLARLAAWVEGFRLPINQAAAIPTAGEVRAPGTAWPGTPGGETGGLLPGFGPAIVTGYGAGGEGYLGADPLGLDAALKAGTGTGAKLADAVDATIRDDVRCLALNMYFEARNESELGKLAVSHVVLNRVSDKRFPNTVCDVIRQGGETRRHRCQFSWWCDGRSDRPRNTSVWKASMAFAKDIYFGLYDDPTKGALWYHADYVKPSWRNSLARGPKIGRHLFYGDGAAFVAAHQPAAPPERKAAGAQQPIDPTAALIARLLAGA